MPSATRVTRLRIRNFRSIGAGIDIPVPTDHPLILVGENNAGKSNIVRALDVVLGQTWPGSREPDDNEFYLRDRSRQITIAVDFAADGLFGRGYRQLLWKYDGSQEEPIFFRGRPGFGGSEYGYVSNDDRSTCSCVFIEAERNLTYQLSYASKYTFLSRIMRRFHKALGEDEATREELLRLFAEVRTRFNGIQPFVDFTEVLQSRLGEFSETMRHRLEVDFEAYNPVNFFHALRLQAVEGTERRALHEMGTGEQQILSLSLAYAYASAFHEGMLLVIEEPEAHLHPLAQQWLARRLRSLAEGGLQLVITTHSSHFVDLAGLPGLVLVAKGPAGTSVTQLTVDSLVAACVASGAPSDRNTPENILPFFSANATPEILEGFFARAVALVEGRTEALALPELWRRLDFDHTQAGLAVIPVGGKGNLAKWRRLFVAYGIPCYVIFDNDTADDPQGNKRVDALRAIGLPEAAHEAVLGSDEWLVEPHFTLFRRDFESTLRDACAGYGDLEAAARTTGVDAKPFIARWVAERIQLAHDGLGTQKLRSMIGAISAILPDQSMAPEA